MLELQSLQKEQQRRELLHKIQKIDESTTDVLVPLKGISSSVHHTDELRLNNNRDTHHFENDANDEFGTTVADDIIHMKSDVKQESSLSCGQASAERDFITTTTTITVRKNSIQ